jgi:membrane protein
VAFYALLALFPALVAAVSLIGLVLTPQEVERQVAGLLTALPTQAGALVRVQLERIAGTAPPRLGAGLVLSGGAALFSASTAIAQLLRALALVFEQAPLGILRARALSLGLTLLALLLCGVVFFLVGAAPPLLRWLRVAPELLRAVGLLRWGVLVIVAWLGLSALYRAAVRSAVERPHWCSPGSVVAMGLLLMSSWALSTYLGLLGSLQETYGALGGVIVLLLWLYLVALAALVGAELDVAIRTRRPAAAAG